MQASITRKLLATSALVALAGVANAQTVVSTAVTTTQETEGGGALTVSATGIISVTTNPAVVISGSSVAANTISVTTGGIIRSNAVSGTISSSVVTGATINNSGTIINSGTGAAINAAPASGIITVNNTGTISGSIITGSGADVITITNGTQNGALSLAAGDNVVTINGASAIVNGNITATGGNDTLTITNGDVVGAINVGAGTNAITVSGTTASVTGGITATTGADTLNVNNATITGNVSLGDTGANAINLLNAARLNGNITGGDNADTTIISGTGVISGTITGAAGADVLTIDRSSTYNTLGTIATVETLNIKSDVVADFAISDIDTAITIDAGKTLTANANLSGTDTSSNIAGTLAINAGRTVTLNDLSFASTGVLKTIVSGTTAGELVLASGALNSSNAISVTVEMGANSGYVSNGTVIRVVNAASGTPSATLTTASQGLYSFGLTSAAGTSDMSVTISRAATASAVSSEAGDAIAAVLDQVGGQTVGTTGDFKTIQNSITAATSTARVDDIVESLTPAADTGAAVTSIGVGTSAGNNVSSRLASLRTSGVATGDGMADKHFWVQGFGGTSEQDDKDGNAGYDANSYGFTAGVDTDTLVDGATVGAALTYAQSSVDSNASHSGSTEGDTYMATLYGSKTYEAGVFVNAQVNGGQSNFDMERQVIGFGTKTKGETDAMQYGAKVEAGKDFSYMNMTLTPLASLQYSYLDMDSYRETGPAALNVEAESFSAIDAGLGGQVAWNFATENGGSLRPSLRAKLIQRMGDDQFETTSRFVQGGSSFNTKGVKADKTSVNLGGSVMLATAGGTEFTVDADADVRDSLTGYTGQLKMRMPF